MVIELIHSPNLEKKNKTKTQKYLRGLLKRSNFNLLNCYYLMKEINVAQQIEYLLNVT